MMRSPEQQYNFAKSLPIQELAKVLQGQSDVVDMSIAEMVLRQKTQAQQAMRGAQAMQMAQSPKVVEKDLAAAQQVMQPRMEQGIAAIPADVDVPEYAGGGIVAFDDGGPVQHFQNQGMVQSPAARRGFTMFDVQNIGPTVQSSFESMFPKEDVEAVRLREQIRQLLGGRGGPYGVFKPQTDVEFARNRELAQRLNTMSLQELKQALNNLSATGSTTTPVVSEGPMGGKQGTIQEIRQADIEKGGVNSPAAPAMTPPYIPRNMQMADITPPPVQIPGLPALNFREIGNQALATTQRIMGERPEVPSRAEALYETRETLKAAGYDFDLFKKQIDEINKQKDDLKLSRKEAANLRLLEAGLGIMGGESPYAFVNIGKGASPAAKGFAEDLKDLKKLERDSEKNIRELKVAQNQVAAGLGEKAENRLIKAQERQDKFDSDLRTTQASLATSFAQLMSSRDVAELNAKVQFGVAGLPGAEERLIDRYMRDPRFAASAKDFYTSRYPNAASRVDSAILQEYAKNPAKLEMLKETDPNLYNYVKAQLAALAVPSASSRPTGTVRD